MDKCFLLELKSRLKKLWSELGNYQEQLYKRKRPIAHYFMKLYDRGKANGIGDCRKKLMLLIKELDALIDKED